jgi:hypothetical protein
VKEILKTIVWFPWAILELLSGYLPPSAKRLMWQGVAAMTFVFVEIFGFAVWGVMYPYGGFLGSSPYAFIVIVCAVTYLPIGALIRLKGKDFSILQ